MMKRSPIALLGAVLTTACMPMEQAALVYSSKQQMGVNVAAGTADSPGLDLNIGYKGLDTAFVPVAVAKHCDSQRSQTCPDIDTKIRTIFGRNRVSGLSEINSINYNETLANIEQQETIYETADDEFNKKTAQLTEVKNKPGYETQVTALNTKEQLATAGAAAPVATDQPVDPGAPAPTPPPPLNDADRQLREVLNGKISAASGYGSEAALTSQIETERVKREAAKTQIAALEKQAENILRQRRMTRGDNKDDALSVYGSFGGNSTANNTSAGLAIGKVFSTGVAAQNVSQGIRNASKLTAAGECMDKAKTLIGPSQDPDVLEAALNACRPPAEYAD